MSASFMSIHALLAGGLLVFGGEADQARRPAFEVASIRPTGIDPSQVGQLAMSGQIRIGPQVHGSTAEYTFMTLRQLVAEAYQVMPFQIVCPDWFLKDRFDIIAKLPAGSRTEDARLMLQSLLEERFQLVLHREPKEEPVAALLVGEKGPTLTESPPRAQPESADRARRPAVKPGGPFGGMLGNVAVTFTVDEPASSVRFDARWITMADLARFLMNFGAGGGRPVVDRTGLRGEYDIVLDLPLSMFGMSDPEARPAEDASDPKAGNIMRSLRRYGLELRNMKAPVEHLVIDRAERKPTEN